MDGYFETLTGTLLCIIGMLLIINSFHNLHKLYEENDNLNDNNLDDNDDFS